MPSLEDYRRAWVDACEAEDDAANTGTLTASIMLRRAAAQREFHKALDPWMPCRCQTCAS